MHFFSHDSKSCRSSTGAEHLLTFTLKCIAAWKIFLYTLWRIDCSKISQYTFLSASQILSSNGNITIHAKVCT